jgi:FtsH-binding integral membrane protein
MATAIAAAGNPVKKGVSVLSRRRVEHFFFSSMSLLMLATVFVGFARSYYLAGVFHAPLPSRTIHIHGAAFSCWILLLVAQTSLVAAGRVDLHRRLGIAGFMLGCLRVVLGVLAATDSLVRAAGHTGRDAQAFYLVPLMDMVIFATLLAVAFRARRDPGAHKRLIYLATMALLIAAVARWPFAIVNRNAPMAGLFSYVFLLALVSYDLWSTRRIHRVTLWAGAFVVILRQSCYPIGQTAAWHAFARWVQTHAG